MCDGLIFKSAEKAAINRSINFFKKTLLLHANCGGAVDLKLSPTLYVFEVLRFVSSCINARVLKRGLIDLSWDLARNFLCGGLGNMAVI